MRVNRLESTSRPQQGKEAKLIARCHLLCVSVR
jgi:hypothetical protein